MTASNQNHQPLKNLKSLPFGGASCVIDADMDLQVQECMIEAVNDNCLTDLGIQDLFVTKYFEWLQGSRLNNFKNLDQFSVLAYSNGTTEAFDKFYINHHARRFRIFRGEYMYHSATWKNSHPDWKYIEDEALVAGDAVIVSMPFSDTGNVHPRLGQILDQCLGLDIPVLIDCAFVGICKNIEFDFGHPAISDITFSLSKTFPVANLRIGMRCQRQDLDDGLLIHQKTNYNNRLAASVGLKLISKYSVDHNVMRYKEHQIRLCQDLDVVPSNTVIFGLGDSRYQQYNRGGSTNRLSLARWLRMGQLPNDRT